MRIEETDHETYPEPTPHAGIGKLRPALSTWRNLLTVLFATKVLALAMTATAADNYYSPPVDRTHPDQVYWGDTHVHTSFSSGDAYPRGNRFSPRVAYRFARGDTVEAVNGEPVRLRRPLDFLVVADHAGKLGLEYSVQVRSPALARTEAGRAVIADPENSREAWLAVRRDPAVKRAIWRDVIDCSISLAYAKAYAIHVENQNMAELERHVRLFRNGRNQALRIPREFELKGQEAIIRKEGDRLIVEPIRKGRLLALLNTLEPLDERFPDVDENLPPPDDVVL